jgi:hypothetical protein
MLPVYNLCAGTFQCYFFDPDKIVIFCTIIGGTVCLPYIFTRRIVMKTLIIALAVTAMLATSAVAKTQRTNATRHVNNSVVHLKNSPEQSELSYCHFHLAHTDPDPQVRLNILRDCRDHELSDAE